MAALATLAALAALAAFAGFGTGSALAAFTTLTTLTTLGAFTAFASFAARSPAAFEHGERIVALALDHGAALVRIEHAVAIGIVFRQHFPEDGVVGGLAFLFIEAAVTIGIEAFQQSLASCFAALAHHPLHFLALFGGQSAVPILVKFLENGGGDRAGFALRTLALGLGLLGHDGTACECSGENQLFGFHIGIGFRVDRQALAAARRMKPHTIPRVARANAAGFPVARQGIIGDGDAHMTDESTDSSPSTAFMPYPVSTLSPPIVPNDLTSFKTRGISQVERDLKQKLVEIRESYLSAIDHFNWNKLAYEARIQFEPVVGETYHLYETSGGRLLSMIGPDQWPQRHLASLRLNVDRQWEVVETKADPHELFGTTDMPAPGM